MSDPRLTLSRDGVASLALEGVEPAQRYAPPLPRRCTAPVSALRAAPDREAEQLDALLFGEGFEVLSEADGFALGRALRDSYVGYVALPHLGLGAPPTHRVTALSTPVFHRPDIKSPVRGRLSMNSLLAPDAQEGRLVHFAQGWVAESHIAPVGEQFAADPVAVALCFLGVPYVWGGRDAQGLDCSGLVQQALYACGRACPRDSDMQRALGETVEPEKLARGDLVFWPGHVGMMTDAATLLHANAFHMLVASEPLAAAVERMGAPLTCRRV